MPANAPHRRPRRGTTAVETAFVLPVLFVLLWGILEFCHAQMVQNVLRAACRESARIGSTAGNDTASVEQRVRNLVSSAIDTDNLHIFVRDASSFDNGAADTSGDALEGLPPIELSEAEPRTLFLVRARVDYNDIALAPLRFFSGARLQAQAFIRHE